MKLHAILVRSSPAPSAPRTLKVFINREDVDFGTATELAPAQAFELSRTSEVQELPVRRALFGKVHRLTLFVEDNFAGGDLDDDHDDDHDHDDGDDDDDGDGEGEPSRLSYLGFKGEWMQLGRAPVNILYEAAPNPNDHALKGTSVNQLGSDIGGGGGGGGGAGGGGRGSGI